MNRRYFLCAFAAVAVAFGPVAVFAENETAPTKDRLTERATTYWDAVSSRDFATIYRLETGSLDGSLTPDAVRKFLGRSKLERYSFREVTIEGNVGEILVDRVHSIEGINAPITSTQRDRWTFVDGDWFHGSVAKSANP